MTAMEFVEKSGVPESKWPTFKEWFTWYQDRGLVGIAKDGEEIVGVAVARAFDNGQEPDHYTHIPNGDNVYVDLTVTNTDGISTERSRKAMKCLLSILWDELGPRKRLIFNRGEKRKTYDYMKFMRKALA